MKKVCPSDDQNAMAIPNIRNRHSILIKSKLLNGTGRADSEGGNADGGVFACGFEENNFGFSGIPQFSTHNRI